MGGRSGVSLLSLYNSGGEDSWKERKKKEKFSVWTVSDRRIKKITFADVCRPTSVDFSHQDERPRRRREGSADFGRANKRERPLILARRRRRRTFASAAQKNRPGLGRWRQRRRRPFLEGVALARREGAPQGLLRRDRAMAPAAPPLSAAPREKRQRQRQRIWRQ